MENSKSSKQYYDELISFMQQKGFIWGPEPEIYGGLAGFYTYAPLGKLLKNNVENEIRKLYIKTFLGSRMPNNNAKRSMGSIRAS